jgi:hypothetical protein
MKKRLFLVSLVLVVALTALLPAAAMAKTSGWPPPRAPQRGDFCGSGLTYVSYMPYPDIRGKMWRYSGEIAQGYLQSCDWDLLAGTAFWSSHDSFVLVQRDGSAKGIMEGRFSLSRPDGVLEGVFEGKISGNLYTGFISDDGTWFSTGGSGVFEGMKAWGKWSADLSYDPGLGTLVGPLDWEGKYLGR